MILLMLPDKSLSIKAINQLFSSSTFPDSVKLVKVIPLFKDSNADSLNNIRPISFYHLQNS